MDDDVIGSQVAQRPAQPGGQRRTGAAVRPADEAGGDRIADIEVGDLPAVACAAPEDLADSAERLGEVLQWIVGT